MEARIRHSLGSIVYHIIATENTAQPLTNINITDQFHPEQDAPQAIVRNLNTAFLVLLSGNDHPLYQKAETYFRTFEKREEWKDIVKFYRDGIDLIHSEFVNACHDSKKFTEEFYNLHLWMMTPEKSAQRTETIERIWRVFFPEGAPLFKKRDQQIQALRNRRTIQISGLNPDPITKPAREILFTSNVLLTIPAQHQNIAELPLSSTFGERLRDVIEEDQIYWYDHPIQIGVEPQHNEVIYGLRGLQEMLEFEQQRGNAEPYDKLSCVLSVSVTHQGLHDIAKTYLEEEFKKIASDPEMNALSDRKLNVFVFTENETQRLINEILLPAAKRYLPTPHNPMLQEVIGVDGEYGRHYSFLKAIAGVWQVFINPKLKATFKIDLDQVFPQQELVAQTGASAFEHFQTALWGAEGVDHQDRDVELGMIAGALVNEKDIRQSLFTPDVTLPTEEMIGDQVVFFSRFPQALSTEAMMMARYNAGTALDGRHQCLQRIHITGGTNGILVKSLRKYRPFTPTFIGRAEDQSYLLSVLFKGTQKYLRYVHKDGLIMRHDKEAFASEAIRSARLGTIIGDYARILWFSYYARALPWKLGRIKFDIDPFTGAFVSRIPITIVYLRLALQAALLFAEDAQKHTQQGYEFVKMGSQRLRKIMHKITEDPNLLIEQYLREQRGWELYYDILDAVEQALRREDDFALDLQSKARRLIQDCQTHFGTGAK